MNRKSIGRIMHYFVWEFGIKGGGIVHTKDCVTIQVWSTPAGLQKHTVISIPKMNSFTVYRYAKSNYQTRLILNMEKLIILFDQEQ